MYKTVRKRNEGALLETYTILASVCRTWLDLFGGRTDVKLRTILTQQLDRKCLDGVLTWHLLVSLNSQQISRLLNIQFVYDSGLFIEIVQRIWRYGWYYRQSLYHCDWVFWNLLGFEYDHGIALVYVVHFPSNRTRIGRFRARLC